MIYSLLENGHYIEGVLLPIGSLYPTQWGFRKVVKHIRTDSPPPPTEPYGV